MRIWNNINHRSRSKDMPFSDLNIDIIENICWFLSPEDIFNVSLINKTFYQWLNSNNVYKIMYIKKFAMNSNPLNLNWQQWFKLRVSNKNKLYTWGSTDLGRLGYLIRLVPEENLTENKNVHFPTCVKNFDKQLIIDLKSNGFSFQILTNNGNLYFTGNDYRKFNELTSPGPLQKDYVERMTTSITSLPFPRINQRANAAAHRSTQRENQPSQSQQHSPTNPNLRLPPDQIPELREFSNSSNLVPPSVSVEVDPIESNFITKVKLPESSGKLISIASGRQHFIALDDKNNIYAWDTGNRSLMGIKIVFPQLSKIRNFDYFDVKKIKCGWNLSSCQVDKVGIIIWHSRDSISQDQYNANNFVSNANYWVIPDNDIIDYLIGNDFIIIIKHEGVYAMNIDTMHYYHNITGYDILNEFYPLTCFNNWLNDVNSIHGTLYQFQKINGCFESFALFTETDILFGNKSMVKEDYEGRPIDLKLPKDIVEIEMGDYHYLALNNNGELYSWGLNSKNCGCLGLGDSNNVSYPSKVKPPNNNGKWLVITASGWHSGGLFSQN